MEKCFFAFCSIILGVWWAREKGLFGCNKPYANVLWTFSECSCTIRFHFIHRMQRERGFFSGSVIEFMIPKMKIAEKLFASRDLSEPSLMGV